MEFSDSFTELFPMEVDVDCHSTASSPLPARVTGRCSPLRSKPFSAEESPVSAKRRRMNPERPKGRRAHPSSNRRSPRLSPTSLHRTSNDLTTLPFDSLPKFSIEDLTQDKSVDPRTLETLSDSVLAINRTFDSLSETNLTISRTIDELSDSQLSSPGRSPRDSPAPPFLFGIGKDVKVKGKYRKDELWAAIESDYQYLMDEEIIEQCKVRLSCVQAAKLCRKNWLTDPYAVFSLTRPVANGE